MSDRDIDETVREALRQGASMWMPTASNVCFESKADI